MSVPQFEAGEWLLAESQRLARFGSWEWDLRSDRFTWSDGMFPLYGLPPGTPTPTPKSFLDIVHPEDRAAYAASVRKAMATGGVHSFEHRILTPDGAVRHIVGWAEVRYGADGRVVQVVGSAQDQTLRVERDRAVAHSQQLYRLIVDSSPIGIALLDLGGRWLHTNAALCALAGRTAEELLGQHFSLICHPDDDLSMDATLRTELVLGSRPSYRVDRHLLRPDGEERWVDAHVSLLHPPDAGPPQLLAQMLDVTERHRIAAELGRQARTDPLTGIANRRAWQQHVDEVLAVSAATGSAVPAAILDLDRFKAFNDTYGHGNGDQLLVDTTAAWTTHLRHHTSDGVLARLGGEEFGLLLPGLGRQEAFDVLSALLTLLPHDQTASAGLTLSQPDDDLRTLMSRADAALYTAKRQGRNRVEVQLLPVTLE